MKKLYKLLVLLLLIIIISIINNNVVYATYTSTDLKSNKQQIHVGDTLKFKINLNETYSDNYNTCTVTSSNNDIVSVKDKGNQSYEITGIKQGNATIKVSVKYYTRTSVSAIENIDIEVMVEKTVTEQMKEEVNNYENADLNKLDKNASAKDIKYAILKDENNTKLKQIAKNDIEKIKSWSKTVNDFVATDPAHYNIENQFGTIKKTLEDILMAQQKGQNIDEAISNNSEGIESTKNLTDKSIDSYIIKLEEGEDRKEKPFVDIFDNVNYYIPSSEDAPSEFTDKASIILTVITNMGMVIAVLMSAILGIKYMLGSLEEKADYKKGMIPYLVGAFLLFGICAIVKVMQQFGESINNI